MLKPKTGKTAQRPELSHPRAALTFHHVCTYLSNSVRMLPSLPLPPSPFLLQDGI